MLAELCISSDKICYYLNGLPRVLDGFAYGRISYGECEFAHPSVVIMSDFSGLFHVCVDPISRPVDVELMCRID